MKIESIRPLTGPNVYSYRPVLLMRLDLGELVERESREFNGFNERLLTILPGINNHHCSLGRPRGFVTRLEEGTYFGHIVEHVALELTELARRRQVTRQVTSRLRQHLQRGHRVSSRKGEHILIRAGSEARRDAASQKVV